MLVLTRKKSEEIKIGNNITIKVIQTGKGTIKLGIEAPQDVRVLRGELTPFEDEPVQHVAKVAVEETAFDDSNEFEEDAAPLQKHMTRFRMTRAMYEMA